MSKITNYIERLKERRKEAALRSNVVFGQTLGWALTMLGAYHYFIQLNPNALNFLILGNFLLLIGVGLPQLLELPRRILNLIGTLVSGIIFKAMLAVLYFAVVFPLGILLQKTKGTAPFYSWKEPLSSEIEGWTRKVSSDESYAILNKDKIASNYFFQLFSYFQKNGDVLILPCLFIGLAWGLVVFFVQTTPLAPMIYALF